MSQNDFGILAVEVHFPRYYIAHSDLELVDDCVGKYTKGLEQEALGVCSVEEDISSVCLTVVCKLISRLKLDLRRVGFLEVGTETLIDKSKSTKSVLMQLFEQCGNFDVEGVDVKNACFGGTAALFHAMNWLESTSWDGRLALVVAADIAVYGTKAARPTGGAGAVAILLGPNAPLAFDPGLRVHHVQHRYDFYKPDLSSEYPTVDGKLSIQCYREALISCYRKYKRKVELRSNPDCGPVTVIHSPPPKSIPAGTHAIDFVCFHSPFSRLVRKSFGWLALEDVRTSLDFFANCQHTDAMRTNASHTLNGLADLVDHDINPGVMDALTKLVRPDALALHEDTRDLDGACMEATKQLFEAKVAPSLMFARQVGNMYTASLYACLASLLLSLSDGQLRGRRVLMYSYGSGLAAAMFSLSVHPTRPLRSVVLPTTTYVSSTPMENPVFQRLFSGRTRLTVAEFEQLLEERQKFHNAVSFTPVHRHDGLFPGSFYLDHVDGQYRRTYKQVPLD